jgi:hypothetical protein
MYGVLTPRVLNFKLPPEGAPSFKKGSFDLELGVTDAEGKYTSLVGVYDCALLESKAGGLYAAGPTRPMIKRQDGVITIARDEQDRERYLPMLFFIKGSEEGRLTEASFKFKNLINDQAIAALAQLQQEGAGVGARVIPADAPQRVDGGDRGSPVSMPDDLPF